MLDVLVFVHELGHLLAAILVKVKVNEFSIGFGKKFYSKKIKNITYNLRLLPLGGFVELNEEDFPKAPVYKQCIVILSGVFFNIVFATILSILYYICFKHGSFSTDLSNAFNSLGFIFTETVKGFFSLFLKQNISNISGPIGTIDFISSCINQGIQYSILIAIILNVNLAVFNLIPIPGLDGGGFILALLRLVIKKEEKVSKIQSYATAIGFLIIVGLTIVSFFSDIYKIII